MKKSGKSNKINIKKYVKYALENGRNENFPETVEPVLVIFKNTSGTILNPVTSREERHLKVEPLPFLAVDIILLL